MEGIGPSTSVLSGQRSTTELHTHYFIFENEVYTLYSLSHSNQQLHTQEIYTFLLSLKKNMPILAKNPIFSKQKA